MVRDIPKYLLRKSSQRGKMGIKTAVVAFTVRVMMNATEDRTLRLAGLEVHKEETDNPFDEEWWKGNIVR